MLNYDNYIGQTMQHGTNGCVDAVVNMGGNHSSFLAQEANRGVASVPVMVGDAQKAGLVVPYDPKNLTAGDTLIYGDNDHTALYDGNGGYYGNSSSQNQIVHGSDFTQMGGLQPTSIIKTGQGNFNYQAKDANGNTFLNMAAHLRTSNPNERFDQQSIMDILSRQTPTYESQAAEDYRTRPDYDLDLLGLPQDVAKYVRPVADKLMANRDADLKARMAQESQQSKLQQAVALGNLISGSNSIDNRREYAALGKMFGINMPDGADQFVSGGDLLKSQIQQNQAEQNYNQKNRQMDMQDKLQRDQMDMKWKMFNAGLAAKQDAAAARGGGGGAGGKGPSQADAIAIIKLQQDYGEKHPGENNPYDNMLPYAQQALENRWNPPDAGNYTKAAQDWTDTLEQNADSIYNNKPAQSREALTAYIQAKYPMYGEELAADTPWGDFGFNG